MAVWWKPALNRLRAITFADRMPAAGEQLTDETAYTVRAIVPVVEPTR